MGAVKQAMIEDLGHSKANQVCLRCHDWYLDEDSEITHEEFIRKVGTMVFHPTYDEEGNQNGEDLNLIYREFAGVCPYCTHQAEKDD